MDIENRVEIYGIMGVIEFLSGWFIIFVTEREFIGKLGEHEIYKVKKTSIQEIPNHIQITEEEVNYKIISFSCHKDPTKIKLFFSLKSILISIKFRFIQ